MHGAPLPQQGSRRAPSMWLRLCCRSGAGPGWSRPLFALPPLQVCNRLDGADTMLLCEGCNRGGHTACLHLDGVPSEAWVCAGCAVKQPPAGGLTLQRRRLHKQQLLQEDDEDDSDVEDAKVRPPVRSVQSCGQPPHPLAAGWRWPQVPARQKMQNLAAERRLRAAQRRLQDAQDELAAHQEQTAHGMPDMAARMARQQRQVRRLPRARRLPASSSRAVGRTRPGCSPKRIALLTAAAGARSGQWPRL